MMTCPAPMTWDCIKAQCNDAGADNDLEGCITGIREHVAGPTWHCRGNDPLRTDDDHLSCVPTVQPGRCGYDFAGDCEAGRESGEGNAWQCLGPDDTDPTDDDNCAIGQCPTISGTDDTCLVGTYDNLPGDDWKCKGSNTTGTNDDVTCEPIVDGVCHDLLPDTCESGTYEDEPGRHVALPGHQRRRGYVRLHRKYLSSRSNGYQNNKRAVLHQQYAGLLL